MLSPEQIRAMAAEDGLDVVDDKATGALDYAPAPKINPADDFAAAVGYQPKGSTNSLKDRFNRLKDVSLQDVGDALETFNPGGKIGEAIGTSIAKMRAKPEERQFIEDGPSTGEILGDVAQTALTVAPIGRIAKGLSTAGKAIGLGEKVAGKVANVATGLGAGYGYDVANKFAEDKEDKFQPGVATAIGAIPLAGEVAKGATRLAGEAVGKATGTGYGVIKQAFEAASEGGAKAKAFREGLRGKVDPEEILQEAKQGLGQIIKDRRTAYQEQLKTVADNTKVFDVSPVEKKFSSMLGDLGVTLKPDGDFDFTRAPGLGRYEKDVKQLIKTVEDWGNQKDDLTVVGIDKLKQTIDDFRIGSSDSKKFDAFVTALRDEAQNIVKKEPGYDKLVKDYQNSSGIIEDIQKGLSLGDKTMVETSFKKLTSALRQNNDFRKQFISELDEATGGNLLSKIAGQQLNEALPRGLAGTLAPIAGVGASASGVGAVPILMTALGSSPRVVGEIINAIGFAGEKGKKILKALQPIVGELQAPGDYLLENQTSKRSSAIDKTTQAANTLSTDTNIPTTIPDTVKPVNLQKKG